MKGSLFGAVRGVMSRGGPHKQDPTSLNLSLATTTLLWENMVFPFLVATMSIRCWQMSVSQKSVAWCGSCCTVMLNFSQRSPCQGSWVSRPCSWAPSHLYPRPVSSHSSSSLPPAPNLAGQLRHAWPSGHYLLLSGCSTVKPITVTETGNLVPGP